MDGQKKGLRSAVRCITCSRAVKIVFDIGLRAERDNYILFCKQDCLLI